MATNNHSSSTPRLAEHYPLHLAGRVVHDAPHLDVLDKWTGEIATRVTLADEAMIDEGIAAAVRAFEEYRRWPSHRRQAVLRHVVARMTERREELALALCIEAGKTRRDARGEVDRGIDTFRIAMEEATRIYGEVIPLDISPRAEGYHGHWKRVPLGPCSFISPFNFPLNLVAHKIAPALAVGCSFVLKPASRTPLGALLLGEILAETDLPAGSFNILPCSRGGADRFTTDERLKLLSFPGSPDVGWDLKARAGKKKVVLELGGNAACVVDRGVDLEDAVERLIIGAFYQSGQSCIGVQRILVHEDHYAELKTKLCERAETLRWGDPLDEGTFLGPMIHENEARRIESWVEAAVSAGAKLLVGGRREGCFHEATLLEDVPHDAELYAKEAFGPVALLEPFNDFGRALEVVNDSVFGLQAGVFTNNLANAQRACDELEVGGVIINDVPSLRVDNMPYGGVKDSGLGREGIRFAMEDMTEIKMIVFRQTPRD